MSEDPASDVDATARRWSVWRQDDNGNQFLVESGLTRSQAEALAAELESHGHKQLYWVTEKPEDKSQS